MLKQMEVKENIMKTFSKTDVGRKRETNQDYVYARTKPVGKLPNLFAVADGMGGT